MVLVVVESFSLPGQFCVRYASHRDGRYLRLAQRWTGRGNGKNDVVMKRSCGVCQLVATKILYLAVPIVARGGESTAVSPVLAVPLPRHTGTVVCTGLLDCSGRLARWWSSGRVLTTPHRWTTSWCLGQVVM